ncbi:hypothetical protein B0J14DRAFT_567806 [Halenospora varia]|nr:hypothetical protein B0J14DRAFT_567806 [Halenospora varia]
MHGSTARVFDFCPPSGTKRVHVCGSWDNYAGSALTAGKPEQGLWTVTVNIPITIVSHPKADFVQKYWYYYLVDDTRDYDKNQDSEIESTTGQVLNHFIISIGSCEGSPPGTSHIIDGVPLPLSEIKMPTPIVTDSTKVIRLAHTFEDECTSA